MRMMIIALGSRGDIQPYIALGSGLLDAGHDVRLMTHENYKAIVTGSGLEFHNARGNAQEIAESEEMQRLLEKGNFIAITRLTAREARRAAVQWAEDGLASCHGADVIIVGLGGLFLGIALAEKLSIPVVQAYLAPFTPTAAFPGVLLPSLPLPGGVFNRVSHGITRQMMWQGYRSADLAARRVLGLPAASWRGPLDAPLMRRSPVVYGYSPLVVPRPPDWPATVHVTGYWYLDPPSGWTPPDELVRFLDDGPPPIYIGFGSMSSRRPEETTDLVLRALTRTGQRAVLVSGWGGFRKADLPDSVLMIDSVPHDWLFRRVAAVVHHGGAGTTAAGLQAGVPSIIIPFFGDQPFWGQRVAGLGVGPEPIPRRQLSVERLATAIEEAVVDKEMRRRAADLGEQIRAENGVGRAVEVIQAMPL